MLRVPSTLATRRRAVFDDFELGVRHRLRDRLGHAAGSAHALLAVDEPGAGAAARQLRPKCHGQAATQQQGIVSPSLLLRRGCKDIRALVLVAAPEGIALMDEKHPDVDIYTASIDSHLNEHGYIIPGLGDAGDKIFGTRHN